MNLNGLIMFNALNGNGDVLVATGTAVEAAMLQKEFEAHLAHFHIPTTRKLRRLTMPNGRTVTFLAVTPQGASSSHCNHIIVVNPHNIEKEVLREVRYMVGGKGNRTYMEFTE